MLDLKSLELKLATGEVVLGKKSYPIRALSARESRRLRAALPRPVPKSTIPDPNKGSLAPPIPNENEPGYAERYDDWFADLAAASLAVALDFVPAGRKKFVEGEPAGDAVWVRAAIDELTGELSDLQIKEGHATILSLLGPRRVREELVVDLGPETAEDLAARFKLPERYARGDAGLFVRLCQRNHIDPFRALGADYDNPTVWALLIQDMVVAQAEGGE